MQVPLELTFKNMHDNDNEIKDVVEEKIAKLEAVCNNLISCHVAIEQIQNSQRHDHSYHVRVVVNFPTKHEVVVTHDPEKGKFEHKALSTIVRETFKTARRKVQQITEKQFDKGKAHASKEFVEEEIDEYDD